MRQSTVNAIHYVTMFVCGFAAAAACCQHRGPFKSAEWSAILTVMAVAVAAQTVARAMVPGEPTPTDGK